MVRLAAASGTVAMYVPCDFYVPSTGGLSPKDVGLLVRDIRAELIEGSGSEDSGTLRVVNLVFGTPRTEASALAFEQSDVVQMIKNVIHEDGVSMAMIQRRNRRMKSWIVRRVHLTAKTAAFTSSSRSWTS